MLQRIVRMRRVAVLILGLLSLLMVSDFVLRSIVPAFQPAKTDFSELYTSSWLWRHGLNPYDSDLATATQQQLLGVSVQIAPIYPPTTLALISPFTFLPWGWANFVWLMLALGGVAVAISLVLRLRGSVSKWDLRTLVLVTLILCFDPLHQAFHLGNIALFVIPLSFWGIFLGEKGRDGWAGVLLGFAACLKPQIGCWILLYYFLQKRVRFFLASCAAGALTAAILVLRPIPIAASIAAYRMNLHHWFAPGRPYGFTEGALPFHVNIVQVILYQLCQSVVVSNLMAHAFFLTGIALWGYSLWRRKCRAPAPLAMASLLALSFLSLYHSVSDATILTLALCWAFPIEPDRWSRLKILTCVLFVLMMLPGHSALLRLSPHLSAGLVGRWWWKLILARYFVWLLLMLNGLLLAGLMSESDRTSAEKKSVRQQSEFVSNAKVASTS